MERLNENDITIEDTNEELFDSSGNTEFGDSEFIGKAGIEHKAVTSLLWLIELSKKKIRAKRTTQTNKIKWSRVLCDSCKALLYANVSGLTKSDVQDEGIMQIMQNAIDQKIKNRHGKRVEFS